MQINISYHTYERLKELLEILDTAKQAHDLPGECVTTNHLTDEDELIEPWSPSDWKDEVGFPIEISCPGLTVGVLRMASKLREELKL